MDAADDGAWAYQIFADDPVPVCPFLTVCQPKALVAIQGYQLRGRQYQQWGEEIE